MNKSSKCNQVPVRTKSEYKIGNQENERKLTFAELNQVDRI